MKKGFLTTFFVFGLYFGLFSSVNALDVYYVPDENPVYEFNAIQPDDSIYADGDPIISVFPLNSDLLTPLFEGAIAWLDYIQVASDTPVKYAVNSVNDYNAYALSPYIDVSNYDYRVTYVNAVLNNSSFAKNVIEKIEKEKGNF